MSPDLIAICAGVRQAAWAMAGFARIATRFRISPAVAPREATAALFSGLPDGTPRAVPVARATPSSL